MLFYSSPKKATAAPVAQTATPDRGTTKRRLVRNESTILAMPGAYPKTKTDQLKREATLAAKPLVPEVTLRTRANIIKGKERQRASLVHLLFEERKKVLRGQWYAKKFPHGRNNKRAAAAAVYEEMFAKYHASPEGAEEFHRWANQHLEQRVAETERQKAAWRRAHAEAKKQGLGGYSFLSVEDMVDESMNGIPLGDSVDSFFYAAAASPAEEAEDAARAERFAERERECAEAKRQYNEMLEDQARQQYLQAERERIEQLERERVERLNREAAERIEAEQQREAEAARLVKEEWLANWPRRLAEMEEEKRAAAEAVRAKHEENMAKIRRVVEDCKRAKVQREAEEAQAARDHEKFEEDLRLLKQKFEDDHQARQQRALEEQQRRAEEKRREEEKAGAGMRRLQAAVERAKARRAAEERAAAEEAAKVAAVAANAEAFARAADMVKNSTDPDAIASALYDMSLYAVKEPDAVLREYAVYEWKWASLKNNALNDRSWPADMLPWPLFRDDLELLDHMEEDGFIEHIQAAIAKFVLNEKRRGFENMSQRQRAHKELLLWHPDKFVATYLPFVPMDQHYLVTKTVHLVSSTLTGLLTKPAV